MSVGHLVINFESEHFGLRIHFAFAAKHLGVTPRERIKTAVCHVGKPQETDS